MAYSVDTYSGSRTFIVEDGTINNSLDIRLIGKNYAGYGEAQNENFLHLLENFAGTTPPLRPLAGQIWYDSAARKLKYWDSAATKWKASGGTELGENGNPPTGLSQGDFWWDNAEERLYVFNGTAFVAVGTNGIGINPYSLRAGPYISGNSYNGESEITWSVNAAPENTPSTVVARDSNGNFSAGIVSVIDLNSTSDARLKTNVNEINGLDLIEKIRAVGFDWVESGKRSYGVIAQELAESFPELVIERDDGMNGVSYIPMIAMLVSAVQQLNTRVQELERSK